MFSPAAPLSTPTQRHKDPFSSTSPPTPISRLVCFIIAPSWWASTQPLDLRCVFSGWTQAGPGSGHLGGPLSVKERGGGGRSSGGTAGVVDIRVTMLA